MARWDDAECHTSQPPCMLFPWRGLGRHLTSTTSLSSILTASICGLLVLHVPQFLIMLQDDDIMPPECNYLPRLLTIFEAWPRVGIIGGKNFM